MGKFFALIFSLCKNRAIFFLRQLAVYKCIIVHTHICTHNNMHVRCTVLCVYTALKIVRRYALVYAPEFVHPQMHDPVCMSALVR
jgi:hypothetical protein